MSPLALLGVLLLTFCLESFAQQHVSGERVGCGTRVPQACLWAESAVTPAELGVFDRSLSRVAEVSSSLVQFAPRWNAWATQHWWASGGYWSPHQVLSSGEPYLLFRRGALEDERAFTRLLAHELAHAQHYRFQPGAANWLREGVALLAEYQVTGAPPGSHLNAQQSPGAPLNGELDLEVTGPSSAQSGWAMIQLQPRYGEIFLYFSYVDRVCLDGRLLNALLSEGEKVAGPFDVAEWSAFLARASRSGSVCRGGMAASFRAYARARYAPDLSTAAGYVWPFSMPAPALTRSQASALPRDRYRAAPVEPLPSGSCAPGEERLPSGQCLLLILPPAVSGS